MGSEGTINAKRQKGFALVVVLITLMVLSLVVASLLRNQTLALRETSMMFTATKHEQDSRNAHQACVERIRDDMRSNNNASISWVSGGLNEFNLTVNRDTVNCQLALIGVPVGGGVWTPLLSVTTVAASISHTTEMRYELCVGADVCAKTSNNIQAVDGTKNGVSLTPTWKAGSLVQVSGQ